MCRVRDPISNREAGCGRYDIRLEPDPERRSTAGFPLLITTKVRFDEDAEPEQLQRIAQEALGQIAARGYDARLPQGATGRLR